MKTFNGRQPSDRQTNEFQWQRKERSRRSEANKKVVFLSKRTEIRVTLSRNTHTADTTRSTPARTANELMKTKLQIENQSLYVREREGERVSSGAENQSEGNE